MSYIPPMSPRLSVAAVLVVLLLLGLAVWPAFRSAPDSSSSLPPATAPAPASSSGAAARIVAPASAASIVRATPSPRPSVGPLRPPAERRQLAELERENAELRRRLEEMLNWIVENVQGRYPLPEEQMKNLRIAPVDDALLTSEDLIQLLRLTPEEVDRMDASFIASRSILYELEDSTLDTMDGSGPDRLLLHGAPYPEEGAEVSAVLYSELLDTLGKARFARFMQVSGEDLNRQFDYFGNRDRTLNFQLLTSDNGDATLFIRDETATADPDDPLVQHISATERIVDALPDDYLPYASRLPALLAPFAE